MKFRSEYTAQRGEFSLSPRVPSVLLGSCFADNMRRKMNESLWGSVNPFGVLFNPLSIASNISLALSPDFEEMVARSVFQNGEVYSSWLFDSKFSALTPEEVIERIETARTLLLDTLAGAEALFITFGTSYCYFLKDSATGEEGEVVANCHKQPQKLFSRRRVSISEIVEIWNNLLERLHLLYPSLRVVFTVSPVRHLRDGMAENNRSKAVLQLAVEELCIRHTFCSYFPAYEIMNDDLRDYRFYASDLAHPSEEGVEYIWEKFQDTYLDEQGKGRLREGGNIYRRLNHRPILPDTPSALSFRQKTEELLQKFNKSLS